MTANDVYNIANALPKEELDRLCDMLGVKVQPKVKFKKKRKPLPDFTVEDGIRHIIETHFNKIRKP